MYRAYFVDDEPLVLEELTGNPMFAECGFQIVGASENPVRAMKEIRKLNPDVVFADLRMPGLSGVDLMEELFVKGASCEFVIISAYPEFEESRRFFLNGGFDYLLKPLSGGARETLDRLSGALARKKAESPPEDSLPPELNEIAAYIRENAAGKVTLDAICEKFDKSPVYICRLFTHNLGTTLNAFVTKQRMEEAARLLMETRKEISEIAALCGYKDYFYFCRVFRKHHSCAPSALRKSRGGAQPRGKRGR
jgi:two-component system response regulator YesN